MKRIFSIFVGLSIVAAWAMRGPAEEIPDRQVQFRKVLDTNNLEEIENFMDDENPNIFSIVWIDPETGRKYDALHYIVYNGYDAALRALIGVTEEHVFTPAQLSSLLNYAITMLKVDLIPVFFALGADPFLPDVSGETSKQVVDRLKENLSINKEDLSRIDSMITGLEIRMKKRKKGRGRKDLDYGKKQRFNRSDREL